MGIIWARCCECCDTEEDTAEAAYGANNESLLLTRSNSVSGDWTGSHSPEEGRSRDIVKASYVQFVQMPKLVPATAEEEREYMVRSYSSGTLFDVPPECILCLDTFSEKRPTALSLCACGVNKNTFHLECLLEWRRKTGKTNCPICENELFVDQALTALSTVKPSESKTNDAD